MPITPVTPSEGENTYYARFKVPYTGELSDFYAKPGFTNEAPYTDNPLWQKHVRDCAIRLSDRSFGWRLAIDSKYDAVQSTLTAQGLTDHYSRMVWLLSRIGVSVIEDEPMIELSYTGPNGEAVMAYMVKYAIERLEHESYQSRVGLQKASHFYKKQIENKQPKQDQANPTLRDAINTQLAKQLQSELDQLELARSAIGKLASGSMIELLDEGTKGHAGKKELLPLMGSISTIYIPSHVEVDASYQPVFRSIQDKQRDRETKTQRFIAKAKQVIADQFKQDKRLIEYANEFGKTYELVDLENPEAVEAWHKRLQDNIRLIPLPDTNVVAIGIDGLPCFDNNGVTTKYYARIVLQLGSNLEKAMRQPNEAAQQLALQRKAEAITKLEQAIGQERFNQPAHAGIEQNEQVKALIQAYVERCRLEAWHLISNRWLYLYDRWNG